MTEKEETFLAHESLGYKPGTIVTWTHQYGIPRGNKIEFRIRKMFWFSEVATITEMHPNDSEQAYLREFQEYRTEMGDISDFLVLLLTNDRDEIEDFYFLPVAEAGIKIIMLTNSQAVIIDDLINQL